MMIKTWHEGMSDKETADLAYWERNVLALRYADGWYNDDIPNDDDGNGSPITGLYAGEYKPRIQGWRRVLSLDRGKLTFHIPDDFDVGDLQWIRPNWDGHTTVKKWSRILAAFGIDL